MLPIKYNPATKNRSEDRGWRSARGMDADAFSDREKSSESSPPNIQTDEQASISDNLHNTGRRLVEERLRQKIYVQHFTIGKPGALLENENLENYGYNAYANHDNIYAPFSSALDWNVGKWIKLRGPGSNASTELLQIPEVRIFPINLRNNLLLK